MHFVYGKILHKILFSLQSRSECIHLGEKKLIGVKIDTQSRRSSKNDGPEIKKVHCTIGETVQIRTANGQTLTLFES